MRLIPVAVVVVVVVVMAIASGPKTTSAPKLEE